MKTDEQRLASLYRLFARPTCRKIICFIQRDGAKTFTEIMIELGFSTRKEQKNHANLLSYYLKKLKDTWMIRNDTPTKSYYLTRLGVKALEILQTFEKYYTEYDMNDVNQDGFVEQVRIVRMRSK